MLNSALARLPLPIILQPALTSFVLFIEYPRHQHAFLVNVAFKQYFYQWQKKVKPWYNAPAVPIMDCSLKRQKMEWIKERENHKCQTKAA